MIARFMASSSRGMLKYSRTPGEIRGDCSNVHRAGLPVVNVERRWDASAGSNAERRGGEAAGKTIFQRHP
jgi:hypothetical protein